MVSLLTHVNACRFEVQEAPGSRSFFTEIIASISDIKFAKDGRYMLSRDYMTLKVCISSSATCDFPELHFRLHNILCLRKVSQLIICPGCDLR